MSDDATKIVVHNDFSWVIDPIPGLHFKLHKALKKRAKDYFFNPLYRQKKWDGFVEFYGKTTGRFITGLLPEVEKALERLEAAQIVRESEEGFKLLTIQEKHWDTTRSELYPKAADSNQIKRALLQEIFADPALRGYRYQNRKAFPLSLTIDGAVVESTGQIPLEILIADDLEEFEATCEEARRGSAAVMRNAMSSSGYAL